MEQISSTIAPTANNLSGPSAIVLAAGQGTRMRSSLPKVLHPLLGEPMIIHLLRALQAAGIAPERTVVVIGYGAEQVQQTVRAFGPYQFVRQTEQLGTGHAVRQAYDFFQNLQQNEPGAAEQILVVLGDGPLLTPATLRRLVQHHAEAGALVTMLTTIAPNPFGYGRIVRAEDGTFQAIVEESSLTFREKAIAEINPSVYMFRAKWLWPTLGRLRPNPVKGEYYLTDLPGLAMQMHEAGQPVPVETLSAPYEEVLSVNDRAQLAEAGLILRRRILHTHMEAGVTITDPATTYISPLAVIEPDVTIEPNTHLRGSCRIATGSVIGPNSIVVDANIGPDCAIISSVVENSTLEEGVKVGPFSHVRPGCHLATGVYLGNFAEVSRSTVGPYSKQGHFSFVGDATLGQRVNIGAGTVTANYDGHNKNQTVIGDNVFIGSDTVIRAPATIGDNAATGAGAVVTRDVAPNTTVVGVPAKEFSPQRTQRDTE